jgi:uncharacterized protein
MLRSPPCELSVLRVVIDTVVFVRSLLNPASVWGQLVFRRRGTYRLVVSQAIVAEITDVLQRPEIARKFRFAEDMDIAMVVAILAEADKVLVEEVPSIARDAKDDVLLATAKAAGAEYLVSEDQDLLVLGRHEGMSIVNTATFLSALDLMQRGDKAE